jgi:hypothetical protein
MKKLFFILGFFAVSSLSFAGIGEKYKVNDAAVDQMFAESQDVSSMVVYELNFASMNQSSSVQVAAGGQSVGGFLVRAFFCGGIALHRKYMGGDWGSLWWKYLCIPVAGGVAALGDFCWVLFSGNSALNKFKGSDKWFVWA